jgi:rhodanese-related sulfurtransferase
MFKYIITISITLTLLLSSNFELKKFQQGKLEVVDNGKRVIIQREGKNCQDVKIHPHTLFSGDYANSSVPKECKKTFVTRVGVLQPMILYKGIKTVGELEVLSHIEKNKLEPSKYILIDSRTKRWFSQMTIPTSINLPFNSIVDYNQLDDGNAKQKLQYNYMLKTLNIKKIGDQLDFSNAKSAILFCNGAWCSQSPKAIMKLLNLGYPREKLLWYRGGIQEWLVYGLTTVKKE